MPTCGGASGKPAGPGSPSTSRGSGSATTRFAHTRTRSKLGAMLVAKILFWFSLAALVWTHVGYALATALAARVRRRGIEARDIHPSVSVVVAAHNENDVIERRVRNLLDLDYPPESIEVVVASDASTDGTDEVVERLAAEDPRVKLVRCERGGKVAAQNQGVGRSSGEIVAFSDANALWLRDALRKLVRSFADPAVGYVTGRASYEAADGTNREGATCPSGFGSARREPQ